MEGGSGSGVVYRVVGRTRSKADCGQQTDASRPPKDTTWKKYTDSPGVGAPPMVITSGLGAEPNKHKTNCYKKVEGPVDPADPGARVNC